MKVYKLTDISKAPKPRVSSQFGYRTHPVTKAQGVFHNGIDIPMVIGTHITALEDGVVVLYDKSGKGGNSIRVQYGQNKTGKILICGYAHLHEIKVVLGEKVKKGQVIALSGNTGAGTGAHLHFTTRGIDQQVFDPLTIFEK